MAISLHLTLTFTFLLGCTLESACSTGHPERADRTAQLPGRVAVGDSVPAKADDGQWPMASRDYANTRYSGLDQITTANARDLRVAWTFSTGVLRGQEAAPLVVGSTMYVVTPFPNILYALDLSQPGAPLKWKYEPKPVSAAQGVACCDVVNRGAVYADGRIFYNTLDAQTVAVDAATPVTAR